MASKEDMKQLVALQQADSAYQRISAKSRELPQRLARIEDAFAAAKRDFDDSRTHFEEISKRHREKEEKLKRGVDLLKKTKDRLSEVKTNKEYEAVLKEIEILGQKNSETEDEILAALDEIDAGRGVLKEKESVFEEEKLRCEAERKAVEVETGGVDEALKTEAAQAELLRKEIPLDLLKKYDTIKNLRGGVAVVAVWKEVCDGCHMNIPPQLYNDMIRGAAETVFCPNCNRILYWEDRNYKDDV